MKSKKILDYGCGLGGNIKYISRFGEYLGVDILDSNIDYATQRYGVGKFIKFDGRTLPFDSFSFDEVHCYDVLEHVNDLDITLNDIDRVLKNDGKIVITVPARISEEMLLKIKPDYFSEVAHVRIVDEAELSFKLEAIGYKLVSQSKIRGVEALFLCILFMFNKKKRWVAFQTGSPLFSKLFIAMVWIFDQRLFRTSLKYLFFIYPFTLPIGWLVSQFFPKSIFLVYQKKI
ncbi:MAG: class I SAM-dependent methyltransferase [bacterium]